MGNKEICTWCLRLSKIPKTLGLQWVEGKRECRTYTINPINAEYEPWSTWISILNKPKGPKGTLCWTTPSFPEMNVMFCWCWSLCYFTTFQNKLDFRNFFLFLFLQMIRQDAGITRLPLKMTSNRKEMRYQKYHILGGAECLLFLKLKLKLFLKMSNFIATPPSRSYQNIRQRQD